MFAHRTRFSRSAAGTDRRSPIRRGPYDPDARTFQIVASRVIGPGPWGSLHWTITVHKPQRRGSPTAIRCTCSTYLDERDVVVEQRHERLKDIFPAGREANDSSSTTAFGRVPQFRQGAVGDRRRRGAPASSRDRGSDLEGLTRRSDPVGSDPKVRPCRSDL